MSASDRFNVQESTLIEGVTINGIPLRICVLEDGDTVYWYGDGWCFTEMPSSPGFLAHCEDRYNAVTRDPKQALR